MYFDVYKDKNPMGFNLTDQEKNNIMGAYNVLHRLITEMHKIVEWNLTTMMM